MSVSDWQQRQLTGMATMMQRLGLDPFGRTPCRNAPTAAIDVCRPCASRVSCRGWLTPEDQPPDAMPSFCPKVQRLADLMADLEFIAPTVTRH